MWLGMTHATKQTGPARQLSPIHVRVRLRGTADLPAQHGIFLSLAGTETSSRLDAFINIGPRGAHYLLLSPDSAWMNRSAQQVGGSRWVALIITPTVAGAYADGTEATRGIEFQELGELTLTVTSEAAAPAVRN